MHATGVWPTCFLHAVPWIARPSESERFVPPVGASRPLRGRVQRSLPTARSFGTPPAHGNRREARPAARRAPRRSADRARAAARPDAHPRSCPAIRRRGDGTGAPSADTAIAVTSADDLRSGGVPERSWVGGGRGMGHAPDWARTRTTAAWIGLTDRMSRLCSGRCGPSISKAHHRCDLDVGGSQQHGERRPRPPLASHYARAAVRGAS
jgi:hypothetical protein